MKINFTSPIVIGISLFILTGLICLGLWLGGIISSNNVKVELPWYNYVTRTVIDEKTGKLKQVTQIDKNDNGISDKVENDIQDAIDY